MKVCRVCKRELPLSAYHADNKSADKVQHTCKSCHHIVEASRSDDLKKENYKKPWTADEIEIAISDELSVHELAELLGRSYHGVRAQRGIHSRALKAQE